MQYNRQVDGTDLPLNQTGVDTGMGLERLCAVVQNKDTVYDTDIFQPILESIEKLTGTTYAESSSSTQAAFRVLADHIRSCTFAIADGCTPSNEGRGYVLRKIIRRAALFAQKLSSNSIFPHLSDSVIEQFGTLYPELIRSRTLIKQLLRAEIEKFSLNLVNGQSILKNYFMHQAETRVISGEQAFKLYDTYGFPLELTQVIGQEHGFTIELDSFKSAMEQQRLQSGKKTIAIGQDQLVTVPDALATEFTGYTELITPTRITGLIFNNQLVSTVAEGEICSIITEKSPLYVECGGQISDKALVMIGHRQAEITSIKKINKAIVFSCVAPTELLIDQAITISVDAQSRVATMKNHTATHLLQSGLKVVLGDHIKQSGSLVTPDYLRFDFTHHAPLTSDEIKRIETIINGKIMENIPLSITQSTYKKAVDDGVIAFFGEKYNPDDVRVVRIPGFSAELCGGTHVKATGEIGSFKITENTSLSAGTRRIVALTGLRALELFQQDFNLIKEISQELKIKHQEIAGAVETQKNSLQESLRKIKQLKKELFVVKIPTIIAHASKIKEDILFMTAEVTDASPSELKEYSELLLSQQPGVSVVTSTSEGKSMIFLEFSSEYQKVFDSKKIGEWMKKHGIRGGGTSTHFQGSSEKISQEFKEKLMNFMNS